MSKTETLEFQAEARQPLPLIIDTAHSHSFCHPHSLATPAIQTSTHPARYANTRQTFPDAALAVKQDGLSGDRGNPRL